MTEIRGEIVNETRNKVLYETKYVEWRIPRIFEIRKDKWYESPRFSTTDDYSGWYLGFHLDSISNFINVDIRNKKNRAYLVEYCFGLKKCDGTVSNLAWGSMRGSSLNSSWVNLIKEEHLLRRKSEREPCDILTITCTLKWKLEATSFPEPIKYEKGKTLTLTRLDKLSANFKDLYADKESCDVTLKVQDQEFKAHSLVLKARSSVFSATFKHDTLEKQTGVITIPDCDPHSFEEFIEYLYSGELEELSLSSALNLYYTSNKYDVEEVKTFCIDYLMQSLSIESVCEIAEFADKYDELALFSQVQHFFNKNFSKILLTSGWENLTRKSYRLPNKLLIEMVKTNEK